MPSVQGISVFLFVVISWWVNANVSSVSALSTVSSTSSSGRRKAIIIVDHGSRKKEANDMLLGVRNKTNRCLLKCSITKFLSLNVDRL